MSDEDNDSQEWHELDQASTRKSIRDIIRRDMPDDSGEKIPALRQLLDIVLDEMARSLSININMIIGDQELDTASGARKRIPEINNDLASLRLAVQDPRTGAPSRLALAPTPPTQDNDSWIQLEALDSASRTPATRLTHPFKVKLMPEPPHLTRSSQRREL